MQVIYVVGKTNREDHRKDLKRLDVVEELAQGPKNGAFKYQELYLAAKWTDNDEDYDNDDDDDHYYNDDDLAI